MIKKTLLIQCLLILFVISTVSNARPQTDNMWPVLSSTFQLKQYFKRPEVQQQINKLAAQKNNIASLAARSTPYLYYISQEVRQHGFPGEIALIPKIESAYDPFALSPVGAAGLWQIMPGTGSGLGLQHDWWYDGRRDVQASTQAALVYLAYLHRQFKGDWLLAIAAYHSGEGTVKKAIRRNLSANKATDFWSLSLPADTKTYIPKLLALAAIIDKPEQFKIKLPAIANKPYFDHVPVEAPLELAKAAKFADITLDEFYLLNPGYNQWATSPQGPRHILLPIEKIELFKANLKQTPKQQWLQWLEYTIQPGDTLSGITYQHKTDLKLIKDINSDIDDDEMIYAGQVLLIPKITEYDSSDSYISHRRRLTIRQVNHTGPRKIIYTVQPGDSYARIEQKYAVNASAIRYWNQLPYRHTLQAGQQLILWIEDKKEKHDKGILYYTIQSGDTLSHIAQRFQVGIRELKQWNDGIVQNTNALYPDQRLAIHLGDTTHFYTIKPGDTLSAIAQRFSVSISDLERWNKDVANNKFLYPNQQLIIYRT